MPDPTAAVIVTCYNQERFIRQALDSIAAQTWQPKDVVVIDGFSSDRSVATIEDWMEETGYPITFIRHDRNYGLCATLNQGMDLIESDFVLTLYGDDWLEPDRIAIQVPLLAASPDEVCMVVGSMREVDRYGEKIADHDFRDRVASLAEVDAVERLRRLVVANTIPSPAAMLRADAVREVGGYDESLTFDDYDMWMRLLSRKTLAYHPDIIVNYRLLASSLSRSKERFGDFLLSEARMVAKHVGVSPEIDDAIATRLSATARKLIELGDRGRIAAVTGLLATVDPNRYGSIARGARGRSGLRSVARRLGAA